MNVLCFADLHLNFINNTSLFKLYKKSLLETIDGKKIDMILIAGDIFEDNIMNYDDINPYKILRELFDVDISIPIVCCFGNHEFAYSTINSVKHYYDNFVDRYNVHYVDIEDSFTYNNVNVVGNVLWYDNSLKSTLLNQDDKIVDNWLDSTIIDFVPSIECNKNKKKIIRNIKEDYCNILLTHTVPHEDLNWFTTNQPFSVYNQYSGCKSFLTDLVGKVDWAICGHTHKYVTANIAGINCINIGNDYFFKNNNIRYFEIEI